MSLGHPRIRDFSAVIEDPPVSIVKAVLAVFRSFTMASDFTDANRVYIRTTKKTFEVGPQPAGKNRSYVSGSGGLISWGGKDKIVLFGRDVSPTPQLLLVEVLRVANAQGKPLKSGDTIPWTVLAEFTHATGEAITQSIPAGAIGYWHPAPAISGIIFTALQTASWILSTTLIGNLHDYDGLPLTPANTWEFRCFRSNVVGGVVSKPPPDIDGRNVVTRVIVNPVFDSTNHFSPPQIIEVHSFTSAAPVSGGGTSPDNSPANGATNASRWNAIGATPTTVSKHIVQNVDGAGKDLRLSAWGVGRDEDANKTLWALLGQHFSLDHHRYRRTTGFNWRTRLNEHNGNLIFDQVAPAGRILQGEIVASEVRGVRVLVDSVVVYNDTVGWDFARDPANDDVQVSPTNGKTLMGPYTSTRQRGIFESGVAGGTFLQAVAAERWSSMQNMYLLPGGKFRTVMRKGNRSDVYQESRLATDDGSFVIVGFPDPDVYPRQGVDITEIDGRIWVGA